MKEVKIGVVGYSAQKFDQNEAAKKICDAYDIIDEKYADSEKAVVSGLTDLGIPGLAYREAVKRNWRTVGIACSEAENYDCFPVDETKIVGSNWGDESPTFLDTIDVLVRIGGGNQSMRETAEHKSRGKFALEYNLLAE